MYSIYADGACIYSDVFAVDSMKVINPKLTLEDNGAGSLAVTLPPHNAGYASIIRMVTDIAVQKDGEEIWAGRVLSESEDFYRNRILYCEGELAYFNDSTQPPAEYSGMSVRGYLERLIAVHNSKVAANRRFTLGAVTVVDKNFPTYYTNHDKTMAVFNALVEQYGGHLRVRKVNGVRYLDYLAEYPDTCSQVIQFGSNIIDFAKQWDSTEFATVIVPLGNILAVIVSMVLTLAVFFAYCQIKAIAVVWYMVVAAVVLGFMVSYAAMFGYDKLMEAIGKTGKQ